MPANHISVVQLGTADYCTALRLQQKLVDLRKQNHIGDVLLLLEHNPVITLGRNATPANLLASPALLQQRGVELFESDRGGDITFHGPGQLVAYPIVDLRTFPTPDGKRKTLGVIEFVRKLEDSIIRTCADFRIPTRRIAGLTGVWTEPRQESSPATEAKIAAIGIHISRAVTSHGLAINVNTDLNFFDLIIPCGITAKPVTSFAKELGHAVDLNRVAQSLTRNLGHVFSRQILWVETLDALLGHAVGVPLQTPDDLREIHNEGKTFLT